MALSEELKKMIESNAGRVGEAASNVLAGRPLGAIASMAGGGGQEQRPSIPQMGFAAPIGTTPPMIGGGSAMGAQPSLPEGVNLMESNLPTKNIGGRRNPQTGEMEGGIPIAPDFNQAYQGVDGGFYARRETEDGGFENFQMRPEQYEQFEFSPGDPNTVTQQIDGGSVTYPKGFEPAQPDPNNVAGSGFSQEELRQRALERTQFRLGQAAMDAGRMAELGMTPGFAGAEDPKMRGDFGSMREVGASSISLQPSPMERNRMAAARFAENSGALGRGRPVGAAAQEGVMRMDEARRLAGGDRDAARAIQERQRQGLDPMTGERIETSPLEERAMALREREAEAGIRQTEARTKAILDSMNATIPDGQEPVSAAEMKNVEQLLDEYNVEYDPDEGKWYDTGGFWGRRKELTPQDEAYKKIVATKGGKILLENAGSVIPREFDSIEEVEAASLPPGTPVIVGGRRGVTE